MSLTLLEWLAALTALASVVLTAQRKILCWPVGLVSVVAYAVFFLQLRLYADSGLQVFYLLTGFYGWFHWARGGPDHGRAPITVLTPRQRVVGAVVVLSGAIGLGWFLANHTDASLPFWDSLASGLSVAAQVLLMRKVLESWVLWICVDILSVGIYAAKAAWVTCGLYAIFLVLASLGLIAWQRALKRGEAA
jgi:nicotinamide mononucleotide transporter